MSARTRITKLEARSLRRKKPERLPGAEWADMLAGKPYHGPGPNWAALFRKAAAK